ncbi:hypothetical protein CHS0354_012918 [Potamilus streckersoni]|uniref:Uncharacterized protein n=1 Tax=Potamilus streckersoni TaxID=2493646 RepID=A0AAE0RPD8_9BIVA|nr:hypothetical protein CHS0354_012918 [Potamilus streckersoni]
MKNEQSDRYDVHCNISICAKTVSLGTMDPHTGTLIWSSFYDVKKLEHKISDMSVNPITIKGFENYGFVFLVCEKKDYGSNMDANMYDHYLYDTSNASQLLILPPARQQAKQTTSSDAFNLNFIFIDSVSRHHFFRSLPKTVKVLESMNAKYNLNLSRNKKDPTPLVLDFELVQSLKSRTFESLQALFSGYVNPYEKAFGVLAYPPQPLKIESLFQPLKKAGYQTLWLEDLCYSWEWGLPKDLKFHNESLTAREIWNKIKLALQKAGIDSLGMTYAHCQILEANGVNDHFHGPDNVCYNGRHQHNYSLEYLKYYQTEMIHRGQPFVTFFETNVGHEDTGTRIQTLDTDLEKYLHFLISQTNTLTVMFSDHGNTYGNFVENSLEGRIEIFHPFMFMLIPQRVENQIGKSEMNALIENQHRLCSSLDLHHTILSLPILNSKNYMKNVAMEIPAANISEFNKQFNVSSYGLLRPVWMGRTCDVVPLIMPNLCICDGYEVAMKNDSYHLILAQYAEGILNNKIQRQQGGSGMGLHNCQKLQVSQVQNVRQSRLSDGSLSVKMDLVINQMGKKEVLFVALKVPLNTAKPLQLVKFERITPYSQYSKCANKTVNLQLCVCDLTNHEQVRNSSSVTQSAFLMDVDQKLIRSGSGLECIYLMKKSNENGFRFDVLNMCSNTIKGKVIVYVKNIVLSTLYMPVEFRLMSGEIKFLVAGVRRNQGKKIQVQIKLDYTLFN